MTWFKPKGSTDWGVRSMVALVFLSFLTVAGGAASAEKSVTEEILDIMKADGRITQSQYDELMEKAKKEEGKDSDFQVYWKDGIRMKSRDKRFEIKLGGRLMVDWANFDAGSDIDDAYPDFEGHGTEFRRARLYFEGTLYDNIDFKAQYDFAGGDVDFKDAYIGLSELPLLGNFRVGHFKEPVALEELTSSKYITFMERALPVEAFAPSRNNGFMVFNSAFEDALSWAVGAFEDTDDFGEAFSDNADWNVSARVAGSPWYVDKGERVLHVGLSYTHRFRNDNDDNVRFRARPEAHLAQDRLVDTGNFGADGVDIVNPELALVLGPFSLQGEYFYTAVDAGDVDDPNFTGWYVYGSYFLTGEHRSYKRSSATFSRTKPRRNFNLTEGGWGAWELALRASGVDLNDGDVDGGEETNITAGVNWYLNPNVRVMFNYVYADVDNDPEDINDSANIFQQRFQIDF